MSDKQGIICNCTSFCLSQMSGLYIVEYNGQAILPSFMIHLIVIYYIILVRVLILLSELDKGLAELEEEIKNMTETNLLRQLSLAYSELKRMDLIWDRVKRVCSQTYPDLISQIRAKRQVIHLNFNSPYHWLT